MKIITTIFLFFYASTCYSQNNYCIPNPTNGVNGHSIAHINLESLDTAFAGISYQYFRAGFHHETCYLTPGKSYKIYMTSGTHTVSTLAAWIDWNNDAVFSPTEKLGEFTTTSNNQKDSISFTVPLNSKTGKLWLRVRSSNSASINACSSYSSGETIDFAITVLNPFYEYNFPSGWEYSGTGNYFIDGIIIDNIDNQNSGGPSGPFYSDYSDQNAFITQCNPVYLFIIGNYASANDSVFLYIDYNSDGIFEDNELAGLTRVLPGSNLDSILINPPTVIGDFRMRIIYYSNLQMREVEDYTINILSFNSLGQPSAQISSDLYSDCNSNCSYYGCKGSANFYDYSCGQPTYRHWSVPGASPATSLLKNPIFNFPNSGTYTVTLIDTNLYGSDTVSSQVIISSPLNFNLGSNTTVCTGDSFQLSAPAGNPLLDCYSYLWSTGETTRQIYVHQAGTYFVSLISCHHSDCTGYDTIVVNFSPLKYNVTGGGSYCTGGAGPAIGLNDSETGISYRLYKNGIAVGTAVTGNGNAISFGSQSSVGTYTVVATNFVLSCTLTMNGSIIVNLVQPPVSYNVTGGGTICSGGNGAAVGLGHTDINISYQLYKNGISTGSPIAGNGSAILFPNQTTAGTYTVIATTDNSSCTTSMTGNAIIIVNQGPVLLNVTGAGNFCIGDSLPVAGINNSETGVSYRLYKNGSPVGTSVSGTGNAISFGRITTVGTYTVIATTITPSCTLTMNGAIRVAQMPVHYNVTGGGTYCSGGNGLSVNVEHSDTNAFYQLFRNGNATGLPVSGTGNAFLFPNNTVAGNYTVIATANNSSCTTSMNGTVNIIVAPHPVIYNVSGGGNYCSGSSRALVGLSDSNLGIIYELYKNGTPTGIIKAGTDTSLKFSNLTASGNYTVVASDSISCKSTMTGSANFSLIPQPIAYTLSGGGIYCTGDIIDRLILSGSEIWVRYQLYVDSLPIGNSLNGNGDSLNYGIPNVPGTYFIIGSNTLTACITTMSGTPYLEINPKPPAYNVTGGGHYCNGGNGVPIVLDNSNPSYTYQLYNNNSPLNSPLRGIGGPLSFGDHQMEGFYTIIASGLDSTCTTAMKDTAFITIDPLPSPRITSILPDSICIFSSPISLAGEPPGGNFNGDGIINDTLYPVISGVETVFIYYDYSDPSTHCSAYASASILIDLCIGIEEYNIPAIITMFPNPADDEIMTNLFLNRETDLSIEIINDIGQVISFKNFNKISGTFSFPLNTSFIADGFYLVKINLNNNIFIKKIIIHHY